MQVSPSKKREKEFGLADAELYSELSKVRKSDELVLHKGAQPECWKRTVREWKLKQASQVPRGDHNMGVIIYVDERTETEDTRPDVAPPPEALLHFIPSSKRRSLTVTTARRRIARDVCRNIRVNFLPLHRLLLEQEKRELIKISGSFSSTGGVTTHVFERCLVKIGLRFSPPQLRAFYGEIDMVDTVRFAYDSLKWALLDDIGEDEPPVDAARLGSLWGPDLTRPKKQRAVAGRDDTSPPRNAGGRDVSPERSTARRHGRRPTHKEKEAAAAAAQEEAAKRKLNEQRDEESVDFRLEVTPVMIWHPSYRTCGVCVRNPRLRVMCH